MAGLPAISQESTETDTSRARKLRNSPKRLIAMPFNGNPRKLRLLACYRSLPNMENGIVRGSSALNVLAPVGITS